MSRAAQPAAESETALPLHAPDEESGIDAMHAQVGIPYHVAADASQPENVMPHAGRSFLPVPSALPTAYRRPHTISAGQQQQQQHEHVPQQRSFTHLPLPHTAAARRRRTPPAQPPYPARTAAAAAAPRAAAHRAASLEPPPLEPPALEPPPPLEPSAPPRCRPRPEATAAVHSLRRPSRLPCRRVLISK
eukprot:XP_008660741.1 YLP motif-containing protein 1-like [Zea mays]